MAASKRSNSGRSNYSQGSPGKDVARNIGVVAGLGGLSFFLGFFVLAKMVPDKQGQPGTASSSTQARPVVETRQTAQTAAVPAASSARETGSIPAPPTTHQEGAAPGVTIEPDDQTAPQKPRDMDGASRSALPDTGASPAEDGTSAVRSATDAASTAPHEETGSPTATPTTRRKPRLRGHSADGSTDATPATDNGGISEGDQKPSRIDRDESDTSARVERHSASLDTGDTATGDAPAPARTIKRSTRYRVVAGSYAQRESAERRAQRVKDLGLDADVVSVTKDDGTTVYRVQQGIYRKRANAEAAQKRLSEAGMDADVVKTGSGGG